MTGTIVVTLLLVAALLFWPRVAQAPMWRATVTPLASIIGSGFLILGPVMLVNFGSWGPLTMLVLCALGYAFGSAMRFNIHYLGDGPQRRGTPLQALGEQTSSWVLAFAYFISVAYYLNLFGAFAGRIVDVRGGTLPKVITTVIYLLILAAGYLRGFSVMERLEKFSVSLKLAIIASLLAGLAVHTTQQDVPSMLAYSPAKAQGTLALQLLLGLIVTVQGFETSRYLGQHYNAATRVRSMRHAQWLASAIYLIYAALLTLSFHQQTMTLDETAIIDLMGVVAVVLPPLLIAAALSAQFSAAVADTSASGGLIHELSGQRLRARHGYVLLTITGLLLTWLLDVFEIISHASRAFALYYGLQSLLAAMRAAQQAPGLRRSLQATGFALLGLIGLAAVVFSVPVEG
ncbi:conserved membrane hypothetical protein [Pseudomonas sp. 8Z]|uniref:hypothetical protein n=1 Tax=Pseudomonas sp. 8Z TaxID=2653166 RepID=UPI0012F248F0|nr:hypothetical protein [Pseudomonas sp. 8Z]VXC58504.1 conserved membrane hypothetical protein [Pseudomonas sp. 8Z]